MECLHLWAGSDTSGDMGLARSIVVLKKNVYIVVMYTKSSLVR